jgi:hypothetical protein
MSIRALFDNAIKHFINVDILYYYTICFVLINTYYPMDQCLRFINSLSTSYVFQMDMKAVGTFYYENFVSKELVNTYC